MDRKPALATGISLALVGTAAGVTVMVMMGSTVLGLGATPRLEVPVGSTATSTTTGAATTPTTRPRAVVVQTTFVDEIVTVTTAASAPVPQPVRATSRPAAPPADVDPPPAMPTAAPTTAAPTTAAPVATIAPTAAPTTAAPGTVATTAPATTAATRIAVPPDWGTRPLPPLPTAPAGRRWAQCELHDDASWECQYR